MSSFTFIKVQGMDKDNHLTMSKYLWLEILAYAIPLKYANALLAMLSKKIQTFSLQDET